MRSIQGALIIILALFSSAAMALGLGNIRVLSKPGQPLLAEIPVISSDPGELEQARAGLASPATFERVGLPPPVGLVSELQFQFAQDRDGRAVIRVTSAAPVQVPSVGFLIEVDWGQGRLVREYSALVATPETATAVAEPVIEAPAAAPSSLIVREPAVQPAPVAASAPSAPVAPVPSATPVAAPRAPAPAAPAQAEQVTVRQGQTLSHIARDLARDSGTSLDQAMVALLQANPEAFIRGNVNLLKQGAVLRTPAQQELARVDAAQARAIVREQTAQWRQARAPVPQPAIADAAAAPAGKPSDAGAAARGARLEIAPAVAGGQQTAGMTTGLDAGGEGDMLANEQLRQAREDLATRDAELQELRDRVGELEKLQKQQQSLIAMKDSDLAAAQQRLAEAAKRDDGSGGGWVWLGLGLLVLGAVGWWLSRRRKPSPLPPVSQHAGFGPEAVVAAAPLASAHAFEEGDVEDVGEDAHASLSTDEVEVETAFRAEEFSPQDKLEPTWLKPEAAVTDAADPLVSQTRPVFLYEPEPELLATPEPAAADEARWLAGDMAAVAPLNPAPAGRERLELAIAYLDLGDAETARTLLNEVATGADPGARNEALELLARLA